MAIDAAIFDLDGTLIDSLPGIAFSVDCSLAEANFPPREVNLRPLIGPPIRQIFARLLPQADEQQLSKLERLFRASYDSVGWQKTTLYENAASTLRELERAGVPLFVATNKPSLPTGRILGALGIANAFKDVICRDSGITPFQSKAGMLHLLTARYGLHPVRCVYVGDTEEDYIAGEQAGIPALIVRHGSEDNGTSRRYPSDVIIENFAELLTSLAAKRGLGNTDEQPPSPAQDVAGRSVKSLASPVHCVAGPLLNRIETKEIA